LLPYIFYVKVAMKKRLIYLGEIMKTLIIEVEDNNYYNLLNILNNFKIKVIQNDNNFHEVKKKKYFKSYVIKKMKHLRQV
jgi:hypothetical protein